MTRKSHSTQTELPDLSQDRHVKDFQPINYDYTGSPANVTVPQGVQGVLFAAIGGSGGNTTTRGLLPNLGGKGANVGGYALVKQGDTLTIIVGQEGQANGSAGGQGGWGATAPGGSAGGTNGGGGGGASSIAVNGSTVAVAGGGGGAGAWGQGSGVDGSSEPGGNGGNAGTSASNGGQGSNYDAKGGPVGGAGGGAGQPAGATGAPGNTTKLPDGVNGSGGGGGGGVAGGAGGTSGPTSSKGSGGGGGGAGTSTTASSVISPQISTFTSSGNGMVQTEWLSGFSVNLTAPATTTTAGTTPLDFTVNGVDPNGDPIGNVSEYVTLTSNYPTDVIHGTSVEMTGAGYHTITATWDDGSSDVTSSVNVTVNPASATHVVIEGLPTSIPAGTPLPLGASTADEFGNLISDVTSSATFSSNVSGDVWQGATVMMRQVGEHSISLTVPGYYTRVSTVNVTPAS